MLDQKKLEEALPRLSKEANIWLSTIRPDSRPHLIPIWFVWGKDKIWLCTGRGTQKHRNIQNNSSVALSLEDGTHPIIIEGTAVEDNTPSLRDQLAPLFIEKYEWDFRKDTDEDWILIAIAPNKLLSW